ncbi:hypothetical protein ABTM93_19930, partial [Acinetobacter baumannii]
PFDLTDRSGNVLAHFETEPMSGNAERAAGWATVSGSLIDQYKLPTRQYFRFDFGNDYVSDPTAGVPNITYLNVSFATSDQVIP